jgi:hypothetical protein
MCFSKQGWLVGPEVSERSARARAPPQGYYINSVALYKPMKANAIPRSIHRLSFPGFLYTLSS